MSSKRKPSKLDLERALRLNLRKRKIVKKTKKNKNDKILLPNDKEVIISKQRKKEGIPIDKELMKEFLIISKNLNITF